MAPYNRWQILKTKYFFKKIFRVDIQGEIKKMIDIKNSRWAACALWDYSRYQVKSV